MQHYVIMRTIETQLGFNPNKSLENEMSRHIKIYSDMRDEYRRIIPSKRGKNRWVFVTARPPGRPSTVKLLRNIVEKMVKRSYVARYAYVFEQVGDAKDLGYGFHVHILFQYPAHQYFSTVERLVKDTLSRIAPGPALHIVTLKDDFVSDKFYYINGRKDTLEKLAHIPYDCAFRTEMGLEKIYVHNVSYWNELCPL